MTRPSAGKHARGGTSAIWATLSVILIMEVILDLVLPPADPLLIPAEVIGDAAYVGVSLLGMMASNRSGGRQIGSRRGAVGMGRNRRAFGGGGIAVIGFWSFFLVILVFDWWFSIHHPILQILVFLPEVLFDALLFLIGIVLTLGFFVAPQGDSGRRVGS
ncbi:MAG: hypothetical protein ACYDDZ_06600 [Acidimicrobiales bacterium]